jgi:hypothetical protein
LESAAAAVAAVVNMIKAARIVSAGRRSRKERRAGAIGMNSAMLSRPVIEKAFD